MFVSQMVPGTGGALPTRLQHAHQRLDRAVWAAYGWDNLVPAMVKADIMLGRLFASTCIGARERHDGIRRALATCRPPGPAEEFDENSVEPPRIPPFAWCDFVDAAAEMAAI
jgi:hypothetical protein